MLEFMCLFIIIASIRLISNKLFNNWVKKHREK